ncbi:MAG: acyltransferase [Pseudomonadota bacterium]
MPSLNQLMPARLAFIRLRVFIWNNFWGMDIHHSVRVSMSAKLDRTYPKGVHIGANTVVTFGAVVLAHDKSRALKTDTYIGENCFIGAHSLIFPGVRIGDQCIVGAGSVVNKDVPSNTIVAGNPAKVIRSGIETNRYGVLKEQFR